MYAETIKEEYLIIYSLITATKDNTDRQMWQQN